MAVWDVLRSICFGLSVSLVSLFVKRVCGEMPRLNGTVPFKPPDYVFGMVWLFLYVTTGVVWVRTHFDAPLATLTVLCCLWLVTFTCLQWRKTSAILLLLTATVSAATTVELYKEETLLNGFLFLPFALWTSFASYLNVYDVLWN